jgi:hypothetical protein
VKKYVRQAYIDYNYFYTIMRHFIGHKGWSQELNFVRVCHLRRFRQTPRCLSELRACACACARARVGVHTCAPWCVVRVRGLCTTAHVHAAVSVRGRVHACIRMCACVCACA